MGVIVFLQCATDNKPVNPLDLFAAPVESAAPAAPIVDPLFAQRLLPSCAELARAHIHAEVGRYRLRMARSDEDRRAVCRLRFRVFNLELGEGLDSSYETGLDTDRFDAYCEHLLVEDKQAENPSRSVVGTYRMQSGMTAAEHIGYYSAQEFDLSPYERMRPEILELGRASIDCEHRTPEVLTLLWRGIAQFATEMGLRYLIGCSSLTSRRAEEGWQLYRKLDRCRVSPEMWTTPTTKYECPAELESADAGVSCGGSGVQIPRLLKTYLAIGARIAAPPAWDRAFGTVDFLTLLDLKLLSPAARNRFLAPLTQ